MLEIFAVFCALNASEKCKDVALTVSEESVTPMQLQMMAQPAIAQWTQEHPGWRVTRWGVRRAGLYAKV